MWQVSVFKLYFYITGFWGCECKIMLEYLPLVFNMVCKVPVCYFFEIIVVVGYFYPRLLWSYGFLTITVEYGVSYRAELFLLSRSIVISVMVVGRMATQGCT